MSGPRPGNTEASPDDTGVRHMRSPKTRGMRSRGREWGGGEGFRGAEAINRVYAIKASARRSRCKEERVSLGEIDQQRLAVQEGCRGDGGPVGVSMLRDQLTALQVPECNVALRAAGRQHGRTV